MKVNPILIKILVILNLIFLITIPINLTLIRIAHIPETESIRLSAPYDWISIWSRMDDKDDVAVDVAIDSNDDIVIGGYTMNMLLNLTRLGHNFGMILGMGEVKIGLEHLQLVGQIFTSVLIFIIKAFQDMKVFWENMMD